MEESQPSSGKSEGATNASSGTTEEKNKDAEDTSSTSNNNGMIEEEKLDQMSEPNAEIEKSEQDEIRSTSGSEGESAPTAGTSFNCEEELSDGSASDKDKFLTQFQDELHQILSETFESGAIFSDPTTEVSSSMEEESEDPVSLLL